MSCFDLFDTYVTIIPGNITTSNRNVHFQTDEPAKIEHIPAKVGPNPLTDKFADRMYLNIDYVGAMKNGYIIKDEQTLLEYTVEHYDLKPSSTNPMYMRLEVRQSTL